MAVPGKMDPVCGRLVRGQEFVYEWSPMDEFTSSSPSGVTDYRIQIKDKAGDYSIYDYCAAPDIFTTHSCTVHADILRAGPWFLDYNDRIDAVV